jgi:hypothetical protein
MGSGRWGGCARWRIDKRNGVVCVGRFFSVGIVRCECLRIVVVATIPLLLLLLLLLALGLLLLVQLALVFLVFRYAGLQGIG